LWHLLLIHRFQSFSLIVSRIDQFVSLPLENPAATGVAGTYVKIGKVPRQGRKGGNESETMRFSSPAFFEILPRLQDTCRRDTLTPRPKCTIQGVRLFKSLAATLHLLL
jgi:hypothetical protein